MGANGLIPVGMRSLRWSLGLCEVDGRDEELWEGIQYLVLVRSKQQCLPFLFYFKPSDGRPRVFPGDLKICSEGL